MPTELDLGEDSGRGLPLAAGTPEGRVMRRSVPVAGRPELRQRIDPMTETQDRDFLCRRCHYWSHLSSESG